MKKTSLFLSFFLSINVVFGVQVAERNLLTGKLSVAGLDSILLSKSKFNPTPKLEEREKWEKIPLSYRQYYIEKAEKYLNTRWDSIPFSVMMEFSRTGNRSNFQNVYNARRKKLNSLVLAEIFENKGRFISDIADGAWLICEETNWVITAHQSPQSFDKEDFIDLFSGETANLMAYVLYFFEDKLGAITPALPRRIYSKLETSIFVPLNKNNNMWWMGFVPGKLMNNWNPWICSNLLVATLIADKDSVRRTQNVYKTLQCIDQFINSYPNDGGCDEGPSYWNGAPGALFIYLEALHDATNGKINIYKDQLIRNMGAYIYKMYIGDNYFYNYGDASGSEASCRKYRFAKAIEDPYMESFAVYQIAREHYGSKPFEPNAGGLTGILGELFTISSINTSNATLTLAKENILPDLQVVTARTNTTTNGFFLATKGGHNGESHGHNNVGNWIVYYNAKPLFIDAGVGGYTAKTFSKDRYTIWTMQSGYHNLPTINGYMQKEGLEYKSTNFTTKSAGKTTVVSVDISKAYEKEADIISWKQTITFNRAKDIEIAHKYELGGVKEDLKFNFLTKVKPDFSVPGMIIYIVDNKKIALKFDKSIFETTQEIVSLKNEAKLSKMWGECVYHTQLVRKKTPARGEIKFVIAEM